MGVALKLLQRVHLHMKNPHEEALTAEELDIFKNLEDIKVVFDVGARTSLDYLTIKPDAEYHLFEPAPKFYEWLLEECKDKPNVHVNCFALGDVEMEAFYDDKAQSFFYGSSRSIPLPVKTLDWYIAENQITRLDFLKIDTEGWDLKILQAGAKAVTLARYIQYETWDNASEFEKLLGDEFTFKDIGSRNVSCTRK